MLISVRGGIVRKKSTLLYICVSCHGAASNLVMDLKSIWLVPLTLPRSTMCRLAHHMHSGHSACWHAFSSVGLSWILELLADVSMYKHFVIFTNNTCACMQVDLYCNNITFGPDRYCGWQKLGGNWAFSESVSNKSGCRRDTGEKWTF